jgi:hypothetical protein
MELHGHARIADPREDGLVLHARIQSKVVLADHFLGRVAAGLGIRLIDSHEVEIAIQVDQVGVPGPGHDGLEDLPFPFQQAGQHIQLALPSVLAQSVAPHLLGHHADAHSAAHTNQQPDHR